MAQSRRLLRCARRLPLHVCSPFALRCAPVSAPVSLRRWSGREGEWGRGVASPSRRVARRRGRACGVVERSLSSRCRLPPCAIRFLPCAPADRDQPAHTTSGRDMERQARRRERRQRREGGTRRSGVTPSPHQQHNQHKSKYDTKDSLYLFPTSLQILYCFRRMQQQFGWDCRPLHGGPRATASSSPASRVSVVLLLQCVSKRIGVGAGEAAAAAAATTTVRRCCGCTATPIAALTSRQYNTHTPNVAHAGKKGGDTRNGGFMTRHGQACV